MTLVFKAFQSNTSYHQYNWFINISIINDNEIDYATLIKANLQFGV